LKAVTRFNGAVNFTPPPIRVPTGLDAEDDMGVVLGPVPANEPQRAAGAASATVSVEDVTGSPVEEREPLNSSSPSNPISNSLTTPGPGEPTQVNGDNQPVQGAPQVQDAIPETPSADLPIVVSNNEQAMTEDPAEAVTFARGTAEKSGKNSTII
jgi:hypothetical protein